MLLIYLLKLIQSNVKGTCIENTESDCGGQNNVTYLFIEAYTEQCEGHMHREHRE